MKKSLIILVVVIFIAGISYFTRGDNELSFISVDEQPMADETGATQEGVAGIVDANNKFAFNLYFQYTEKYQNKNIFFSPYSISSALAMVYEGAEGTTAEEIEKVFYFPKEDEDRRASFAKIFNDINKEEKTYKLSTANALWAQKDFTFLDDYKFNVTNYYGGEVINLDFVGETEKSRVTINDWVESKTNNKIKDLIPQGVLSEMTRSVLTNAVYFKGNWAQPFDKKDTKDEDFEVNKDTVVKVPTMQLMGDDAKFNYTENDEVQFLELPYEGGNLSMLVILPKGSDLSRIEKSIDSKKIAEWKTASHKVRVDVYLPKFKFETKDFMKDTLEKMGMSNSFNSELADFSGMTGKKDLFIGQVIHQAFVEVNEEGTEAAAATAVSLQITSVLVDIPDEVLIFRADHPFIFLIQQNQTGNVLFMGRVNNPAK